MNGFIKLYRSIIDWEWWGDPVTLQVWVYCLIRARWDDGKYKGTEVNRGSFTTTIRTMAKDLKQTPRSVRTALDHLKSTGEITVESTSRYTVIAVQKYETYQGERENENLTKTDTKTDTKTAQTRPPANAEISTDLDDEIKPFDKQTAQKPTNDRHTTDTYKRNKEYKNIIIHSPSDAERHLENIRKRLEGL